MEEKSGLLNSVAAIDLELGSKERSQFEAEVISVGGKRMRTIPFHSSVHANTVVVNHFGRRMVGNVVVVVAAVVLVFVEEGVKEAEQNHKTENPVYESAPTSHPIAYNREFFFFFLQWLLWCFGLLAFFFFFFYPSPYAAYRRLFFLFTMATYSLNGMDD